MSQQTRQQVALAVQAVENKKGEEVVILEMDRASGAFTDYFVVCTGTNPRQVQAISDEVEKLLSQNGERPASREGFQQAEWVLLDYVHFVVHIFSERARKFYDLERLWKSANKLKPADLKKEPVKRPAAEKKTASAARKSPARKLPAKRAGKAPARRVTVAGRAKKKSPAKKARKRP
ncbi:MAG TPA: ribosome silencing factor [Candidatus Angelobacter sp.]|nr:ribosome silencing factor [Candidatus Angelobacter sp.]